MQHKTPNLSGIRKKSLRHHGFTIVELLIVIVIIAILASITVVAYNGIQQRARDAQRLQDAKNIEQALRLYLVHNGDLPVHTAVGGSGSWESSSTEASGAFIEALTTSNTISKVPTDPTNTSTHQYRYHRFAAGGGGCDSTKGRFIVFMISDMETSGRPHPQSPGHTCATRNWNTEGDYVFAIFENE